MLTIIGRCGQYSGPFLLNVASYPGSFQGEGKEPGTHCMHMCLIKMVLWVGLIADDVEESSGRW